jgi:F0F1-type ATP synthase assembly protein I
MKSWSAFGLAMQLSWTLLFSLLLPLLAGVGLDRWLGIQPWGVLIGMALGILAATVGVARLAVRMFPQAGGTDAQEKGTEHCVQAEEETE